MDVLSSQALLAGYRLVTLAADAFGRMFGMTMTAAGTLAPARVLVLGAGVAGLQAIATAKRLGGVVSANDVRAASADEVRSVGGTFIDLDLGTADAAGGYAKELAEDRARRQQELLAPHVAASDIVITTAAVPGRAAPRLVTADMVAGDEARLGARRPRRRVRRQHRGIGRRGAAGRRGGGRNGDADRCARHPVRPRAGCLEAATR